MCICLHHKNKLFLSLQLALVVIPTYTAACYKDIHNFTKRDHPAIKLIILKLIVFQVWSPGSSPDGTCISMPERPTILAFASSVAAVDLNLITSGLLQKNWLQREASSQLHQRNTATGVLVWRCTPSPGSEPGKKRLLYTIKMEISKNFRGKIRALQHQGSGLSIHVFLSHSEPVATTGRA